MHHTKDKGDLGVLKAQASLCEQGYIILIPLTEHAPFDLVIYKDNTFKKVQVKYRSLNKLGTIEVSFKSYWSNRNGINVKRQDISQFDICCIYCPNTDKCYFIDTNDIRNIDISLRVKAPKKSSSKCRFADNFLKVP